MSAPKMFEPDHAASTAPIDIRPGAFSAYTALRIVSAIGLMDSGLPIDDSCARTKLIT
jgi:hypothetical protein